MHVTHVHACMHAKHATYVHACIQCIKNFTETNLVAVALAVYVM